MFNPSHPHVIIPTPSGPLTRNIRASFPTRSEKVVAELNSLFAEQAHASTSPSSAPTIGTWHLESTCDAISAFFVLRSREHVVETVRRFLNAAEELKHHPSITVSEGADGSWVLLATCGTHQPAGLSVKDPRLARRIGEIAREIVEVEQIGEMGGMEGLIEWHWRENMKRARVRMDVGAEESGEEGINVDEQRCWCLNTAEDIETFLKGGEKKETAEGSVLTLKGLVF